MKKYYIFILILSVLTLSTVVFAQSRYQIYVHDIDTPKIEYQVGDIITGTFVLSNLSDVPQSDIYYTISAGSYVKETLSVVSLRNQSSLEGPLYIKTKSKDVIPFSYTLPQSLTGSGALVITAMLKDGTLVGQANYPIRIVGTPLVEAGKVIGSSLKISSFDKIIAPHTGPTVYESESISLNFFISPTKDKYTITPTLKLYDRVDNSESLKQTITLDPIITSTKGTQHTIELPVNLDPLVYYGVISFDSRKVEIAPVDFRYIIAGPIATIRNINTETLSVNKNQEFDVTVTYGGQPYDELRPEKQLTSASTTITVVAKNEKGEKVAETTSALNLNDVTRIVGLTMKAEQSAKSLVFFSIIKTIDGKVLDEYSTNLPTEESVKDQQSYIQKSPTRLITSISLFILMLILAWLIYLKRKHSVLNIPLGIVILGLLISSGMLLYRDVSAWGITYEYIAPTTVGQDLFHVTSVSSPLPPVIKTYEPGESFNLSISASYGDCTNNAQYFYAYMYKDGIQWWNETPAYQNTINKQADYVYNVKYWSDKGIELFKTIYGYNSFRDIRQTFERDFCLEIGGEWIDNECQNFATYSAKEFPFSKTYTAPTTPGFHKMYFALFQIGDENDGSNGEDSHQHGIYYQEICVRGAGLCPNESTNTKPIVAITNINAITSTGGTVNWSYDDAEGDKQINYEIQASPVQNDFTVASTKSFSSTDIDNVTRNDLRLFAMTGLTSSTTYYVRMRAKSNSVTESKWSDWTNGDYSFTTSSLLDTSTQTCSCNNTRDYTCKKSDGTILSTETNSSQCVFNSYCSVATTTTTTTFTFGPLNRIGSVKYEHSPSVSVTQYSSPYTYTYSTTTTPGISQSLRVLLTDSDNATSSRTCGITSAGSITSTSTSTSTLIIIQKTPQITLNKGGTCRLDWTITNRPTGMICTLTNTDGYSINLTANSGTNSFPNLQKNTRFTISCLGGSPSQSVSTSVTCRINPDINEI